MGFQKSINSAIGAVGAGIGIVNKLGLIERQVNAGTRLKEIQEARKQQADSVKELLSTLQSEHGIRSSYMGDQIIIRGKRKVGRPRKDEEGKLGPNDKIIKTNLPSEKEVRYGK